MHISSSLPQQLDTIVQKNCWQLGCPFKMGPFGLIFRAEPWVWAEVVPSKVDSRQLQLAEIIYFLIAIRRKKPVIK